MENLKEEIKNQDEVSLNLSDSNLNFEPFKNNISPNKWIIDYPIKNRNFDSNLLKKKWDSENLKLIEFSVRTKFSNLDGISSPVDYVKRSYDKNYKSLVVTDHNNVQSFPEFWESRKKNSELKIVYGCEFEMIEENFPPYLSFDKNKESHNLAFSKKIEDIVYCAFDLETTGLFSMHDEIIDFGYVIWKNKEIIDQKDYLIKPKKNVPDAIYRITNIDKEELNNALSLEEVLIEVRKNWEEKNIDVLVSHNLIKFDLPFLNKAWIQVFQEEVPYPGIDTLPLSWIAIPNKKSYSLEKLSSQGKNKIKQSHRALDDTLLLKNLFEKIIKISKEKDFNYWEDFKSLIEKKFYNRGIGTRITVLAKNKEGLSDLYNLVTISHVDNFFKFPFLFRSDVEKKRENLFIGSTGGPDGEIFSLFNTFNLGNNVEKKIKFYDYIEVRGIDSFSHFLETSRISEDDLKKSLFSIISASKKLGVKAVAVNNVHYCDKFQKKIKDIIVANEGMNGSKHSLYYFATSLDSIDGFNSLPDQHLRSREEIVDNWEFLQDEDLIEEIVFKNPEKIIEEIDDISIFDKHIGYPSSFKDENELMSFCLKKVNKMFNKNIPDFVSERIQREWKTIKKNYLAVYWLSWKVVMKAHKDGSIVGSRGSVGCSLLAYLLNITDINPLPLYTICSNCKIAERIKRTEEESNASCYDFGDEEKCTRCEEGKLKLEGHDLPFETFVGWNGEKTPDIDLNFSGEYQRTAHNYIRDLLGEKNVFRIGTINKLSQQTAENFWDGHLKLRKAQNENFNLKNWCNLLLGSDKIDNLRDAKDFAVNQLKGIKRTTGQHPGGLLVVPSKNNILDSTPLNYPADDTSSEWKTTHFEYSFLSNIFLKLDILGHDEPTILQKFYSVTGKNPLDEKDVSFNDKKVMDVFTNCDTLGIPEFGTDLVKKSLLEPIKPTKFSQLVQISGFSHGTDVWLQNQQRIYKDKKLPLDKLLACREDILSLLDLKGVDKENAFKATEFIRKGKWEKLDDDVKNVIKSKLKGDEGEIYFSILEKIKYIFPKPHAIAYTMTAWRTAYYKVYFPEAFYSILLTHHSSVYDIWLMTFDTDKSIPFRLNKLLDSLETLKISRKEFISISKVLLKLSKEEPNLKLFTDIIFGSEKNYYEIFKIDKDFDIEQLNEEFNNIVNSFKEDKIKFDEKPNSKSKDRIDREFAFVENAYNTLTDISKKEIYDSKLEINRKIKENFTLRELNDWKLTMKEKDLLFTMRVISEIKKKGFNFSVGFDFNNSDINDFKFIKGKMLIPFSGITGVGEAVSKKIIDYLKENGRINDWKEDIKDILNKKTFEQFLNLEENGLIIKDDINC